MPTKRLDNFAVMRAEQPVAAEPPEGSPVVSPVLIEWLEAQGFGVLDTGGSFPGSMDGALAVSHAVAFNNGALKLLNYLRTLVRAA